MNDAVLFRSNSFSLENTVVDGTAADLPLGLDLAQDLRGRLARHAPHLWIHEPILEDWGTVLWVKDGRTEYHLEVHWIGLGGVETRWGIQFSRPRGCLLALLGRRTRPEECRPIQAIVARVLEEDPRHFHSVEWVTQAEYQERL